MASPATKGGATKKVSFGLDQTESTPFVAPLQDQLDVHGRDRRFERDVARLHRLGPRAVGELLREIAAAHGLADDIEERLARYARLEPNLVNALGGGGFPPAPLHAVGDGQR